MCESSITDEMNQPLLHVMIPAFGESPFLEETLNEACKNLDISVRITVVEDPSDENKIAEIVSKFIPRVNYVRNDKRLGIANNFNRCLDLSEGIFTQICGHDDLIVKDPTEYLKNLANTQNHSYNLVFVADVMSESVKLPLKVADFVKKLIKPKKRILKNFANKKFLERLMIGYWFHFPAIIWSTEAAKKYRFNELHSSAMDLQFLIEMNCKNEKFKFVDEKILIYRRHDQSASTRNSILGDRFYEEMYCHKMVYDYAKSQKYFKLALLSQLAIGVRFNAILHSLIGDGRILEKMSKARKILFY